MITALVQVLRAKLVSMLFGVGASGVVEIERGSVLILERNGCPLTEEKKARLAAYLVRAGVNVVVLEDMRLRGFVPPERIVVVSPTADDLARRFTHIRPNPTTAPPSHRPRRSVR